MLPNTFCTPTTIKGTTETARTTFETIWLRYSGATRPEFGHRDDYAGPRVPQPAPQSRGSLRPRLAPPSTSAILVLRQDHHYDSR
jgi:hypothetical protein